MKLEVRNLTKSFEGNQVLHGISFEVESGSALGLLGRNGAVNNRKYISYDDTQNQKYFEHNYKN